MLKIKILGSDTANCQELKNLCEIVVAEPIIDATIEEVTDYGEMGSYGIIIPPALVINEKLISLGKIPTKSTLIDLLLHAQAQSL